MANRWLDSGIDWANTEDYRTSWVIDELYLAFKEKEALYNYHRNTGINFTSVPAWDLRYNFRDEGKIIEIVALLHEWLRSDYSNFPNEYAISGDYLWLVWMDHTATFVGDTVNSSLPYYGIPTWNSDAAGNLETHLGRDLGFIRNPLASFRIDTTILETLYLVLKAFDNLYVSDWNRGDASDVSLFRIPPTRTRIEETVNTYIGNDGSNLQTAIDEYEAASPIVSHRKDAFSSQAFTIADFAFNKEVLQANFTATSDTFTIGNTGVRDSSDNRITMGAAGGVAVCFNESSSADEFSTYDYEEFYTVNNDGTDIPVFEETHPKSTSEFNSGGRMSVDVARTYFIDTSLPAVSLYNDSL